MGFFYALLRKRRESPSSPQLANRMENANMVNVTPKNASSPANDSSKSSGRLKRAG